MDKGPEDSKVSFNSGEPAAVSHVDHANRPIALEELGRLSPQHKQELALRHLHETARR